MFLLYHYYRVGGPPNLYPNTLSLMHYNMVQVLNTEELVPRPQKYVK